MGTAAVECQRSAGCLGICLPPCPRQTGPPAGGRGVVTLWELQTGAWERLASIQTFRLPLLLSDHWSRGLFFFFLEEHFFRTVVIVC